MAFGFFRGVDDRDAREVAELHGLLREREGARDQSLRGNDRGSGRHGDGRVHEPRRDHRVKRVCRELGMLQQERALAEVVEDQRRQDDGVPIGSNRAQTEVTHVGVESLAAGDTEDDGAEEQDAVALVFHEELHGILRVDRGEHGGVCNDVPRAEHRDHHEPDECQRSEDGTDTGGASFLHEEEAEQNRDRDGHDRRLERRGCDFQTLHRGEHRDRRRDDSVAVEQRGSEEGEQDDRPAGADAGFFSLTWRNQRKKGQNSAGSLVVRLHDEGEVFDRDGDHQGPENQRQDAEDVARRGIDVVLAFGTEAFLDRVQRARADVAEDDTESADEQWPLGSAAVSMPMSVTGSGCIGVGGRFG